VGRSGSLNPIVFAIRRPVTTLKLALAPFWGELLLLEKWCVGISSPLIHVR
jgi:hypothetical protein